MRRSLLAVLVLVAMGDAALLLALRGQGWALQLVHRDATGEALAAPPDGAMRVRVGRLDFDYRVPPASRAAPPGAGLPRRTGADSGLADVRAAILWVRGKLRVGEHYTPRPWRLREALAAAADTSRRFYCYSYACAMVAACQDLGYAARVAQLQGHVTSEVFLPALGQWVLADALYDFIARDPRGRPLSLLETLRRLEARRPVVWEPVAGTKGDDDEMDPRTRGQVEEIIRRGNYFVADGAFSFGPPSRLVRLRELLAGRAHVIQAAPCGEPLADARARRLRAALAGGTVAGLVVLVALALAPRRRPR
jgi:hypothetical protein